jgi:signal peptidase I
VVGLPGDWISIVNGHVYRNGVREEDPYIALCPDQASCNFPVPITVPKGDYYVMGDNRGESDDSRFWGPVTQADIIGIVVSCQPESSYCAGA